MADQNPNQPTTPQGPQPATYPELKAAFPKATADFLTGQLDAQATIDQARAAWQRDLEDRASAAEARAKELETKAAEAKAAAEKAAEAKGKGIGVEALRDGQGGNGHADPGDFHALVAGLVAQGLPRHKAVQRVCVEHPEAREAYVAEHNAQHKR